MQIVYVLFLLGLLAFICCSNCSTTNFDLVMNHFPEKFSLFTRLLDETKLHIARKTLSVIEADKFRSISVYLKEDSLFTEVVSTVILQLHESEIIPEKDLVFIDLLRQIHYENDQLHAIDFNVLLLQIFSIFKRPQLFILLFTITLPLSLLLYARFIQETNPLWHLDGIANF